MPAVRNMSTGKPRAKTAAATVGERHKVFRMSFAKIYPLWLNKVERKQRTRAELDEVIVWLTGYSPAELRKWARSEGELGAFIDDAPRFNPAAELITGTICGVRVENIVEPSMRRLRQLDKLVDELAKGRAMEKILRS